MESKPKAKIFDEHRGFKLDIPDIFRRYNCTLLSYMGKKFI